MGDGDSLTVVDLQEGLEQGMLLARAETFWPCRNGERIRFSWENDPPAGAVRIGPHNGQPRTNVLVPEGTFRVCKANGAPKQRNADYDRSEDTRPLTMISGKYTWDQPGRPMIVIILPPGKTLTYVRPKPGNRGVWERNWRICVFWPAPLRSRPYYFSIGSEGALAKNVSDWQSKTSGIRPLSRFQAIICLLLAVVFLGIIATAIALVGEVAVGTWIGSIGTVIGLVVTLLALPARPESGQSAVSHRLRLPH